MAVALVGAGVAAGFGDDNNDNNGVGDDAGGGHSKALRALKIQLNRDTSEPTDVYSWFEITLKAIDVPSQTFDCSIEIHLFWQDFNLPNIFPDFGKEDFIIDDDDVPVKMSEIFENKLSCDVEGEPVFEYYQETGTIYMMFVVECTFVERMELQLFPLDRQFLNMEFNAWVKEGNWNWTLEKGLDWVPEKFRNLDFAVRMVSSITEYELLGPWIDFAKESQPLSIRLRVNRVPTYYFGNIVFPNFLIVAGCFSAFAVPRTEVADRLSVTVTLMLAAVAFRFVVSTMLPKVAYLTIMDKYLLVGFIALIILIAENAICGISSIENETAQIIDYITGLLFSFLWLLIHAIGTLALISKDFYRITWEEMDRIDSEEDPDAEFVKADPKYIVSPDESEFCRNAWASAKMRSPTARARFFEMEHPEIAEKNRSQNVDDAGEPGDNFKYGDGKDGDAVPSKVPSKVGVPSKVAFKLDEEPATTKDDVGNDNDNDNNDDNEKDELPTETKNMEAQQSTKLVVVPSVSAQMEDNLATTISMGSQNNQNQIASATDTEDNNGNSGNYTPVADTTENDNNNNNDNNENANSDNDNAVYDDNAGNIDDLGPSPSEDLPKAASKEDFVRVESGDYAE